MIFAHSFQNFLEEILHHREPIRDSMSKSERFIFNNKDGYLRPEQQQELTGKMDDLRRGYDEIVAMAEDKLKRLNSNLTLRHKEKEEMVSVVTITLR